MVSALRGVGADPTQKEGMNLMTLLGRPLAALAVCAALLLSAGTALGAAGDPTIIVPINDAQAGGTYNLEFKRVYAGATPTGTPVYIYVPSGWTSGQVAGIAGIDPQFDPIPGDAFTPCATRPDSDYVITQTQINTLGDLLARQIVGVNEAHFGPIGLANASDPNSDSLVVLVYNVQDGYYYTCSDTIYTAGYFAPDYQTSIGMNVIVVDTLRWARSVGPGSDQFIPSVVAHELEHLLMNYSDPGELSWVDEGLADLAMFLNGFPTAGSHLTYHQVFHRDTSLTRWGGGLENYGASLAFFLYLWEQAGGNGSDPGRYAADLGYDAAGGDLLIKLIFQNGADSLEGVQDAIDRFNAVGHPGLATTLRSVEELYKDFVVALYLDTTTPDAGDRFVFRNLDFGDRTNSTRWTIDLANNLFYGGRGIYQGAMPNARWEHNKNVPEQLALPFGASYETFRNAGPTFSLFFDGADANSIAPHTGDTHWYGGYESQSDNILNVDSPVSGAQTVDFWTWYFIEEDWDYGYVEALVNGQWVTIPLRNDAGQIVTSNTDPHGNNTERNGLTGTSGGAYFVDQPVYTHLTGTLPAGTTDVRFRYSTDAAYLDTGWFIDDVRIGGQAATLSSPAGDWRLLGPDVQDNNWVVQIISPCDLTPGATTAGEIVDPAGYVYRFEGDLIQAGPFDTSCLRGTKDSFTVAVSNMPSGELIVFDAEYLFRIIHGGSQPVKKK